MKRACELIPNLPSRNRLCAAFAVLLIAITGCGKSSPGAGPTYPVVVWAAAPSPITYGVPLSATQLNAQAFIPGSFSYSSAA